VEVLEAYHRCGLISQATTRPAATKTAPIRKNMKTLPKSVNMKENIA